METARPEIGSIKKEGFPESFQEVLDQKQEVEKIIPNIKDKAPTEFDDKRLRNERTQNHPKALMMIKALPESWSTEDKESNPLGYALGQLKDQVVVDLGAGMVYSSYFPIAAAKAKAYVGVELPWYLEKDMEWSEQFEAANWDGTSQKFAKKGIDKLEPIPYSVVADHMLSFLRRLPDKSVSVFMSGIDHDIVSNPKHREAIANEISRVVSDDGALVQWAAWGFDPEGMSSEEFLVNSEGKQVGLRVFKRE